MYNPDNLENLPPELRQRVEGALRNLESSNFQGSNPSYVVQYVNGVPVQHADGSHTPRSHHDDAWTHWNYSDREWALFQQIDGGAARRNRLLRTLLSILVYLVIVGVMAWYFLGPHAFFDDPGADISVLVTFSFVLLVWLLIWIFVRTDAMTEQKKRLQARQDATQPHRVTFGANGIWEAGTHFPINHLGVVLKRVNMTSQPSVLHFHVEKEHFRSSNGSYAIPVPVPYGCEGEANQLIQRYESEVIHVVKKPYNIPEPE